MINGEFMSKYPSAHTTFQKPRFLDHCASIADFGNPFQMKDEPFKIFNFLTKHEQFLNTVRDVWRNTEIRGCKMFILTQKLRVLKAALRKLNR